MLLSKLINRKTNITLEKDFKNCSNIMIKKQGPFGIEGDGSYFISDKNNKAIINEEVTRFINTIHSFDCNDNNFYYVYTVLDYWYNLNKEYNYEYES